MAQAVQQSQPRNPEEWMSKAEKEAQKGDYQAALNSLDHALKLSPRNCHAWYKKGNILAYNFRQPQAALSAFDEAYKFVTYDNFRKKILNGRGHVLKSLGRNQDAVDAYQLALNIDHSYWQARKGWGQLIFSRFHIAVLSRMRYSNNNW